MQLDSHAFSASLDLSCESGVRMSKFENRKCVFTLTAADGTSAMSGESRKRFEEFYLERGYANIR